MAISLSRRRLLMAFFLLSFLLLVIKHFWVEKTQYRSNWIILDSLTNKLAEIGFKTSNNNLSKLILLWTPFFGQPDYLSSTEKLGCPDQRCSFTSNRLKLLESHAILFHLRDLDFHDLPKQRLVHQRWVLLHHESPAHTPSSLEPLEALFNWTITYRLSSDIVLTPLPKAKKLTEVAHKHSDYSFNKTRMAVWFVSNCKTSSNRESYVTELQKTIPVDIVGKCGTKSCIPKMSTKCYKEYTRDYYFYLSFENSICRDYVTEKLYDTLNYDIVPVVMGGGDYSKLAPPHSVINALNFESPKSLGKFLLKLAKDKKQYNSYFDWRGKYDFGAPHYACQLCQKLNDPREPIKIWTNLHNWWFTESQCKQWPNMGQLLYS